MFYESLSIMSLLRENKNTHMWWYMISVFIAIKAMFLSKMDQISCNQMGVDDIRARHVFYLRFKMTIVLKIHQKLLFIKKIKRMYISKLYLTISKKFSLYYVGVGS